MEMELWQNWKKRQLVGMSGMSHCRSQPQLLPDCIVKQLQLEIFDEFGNHVVDGLEVHLDLEGFEILDKQGPRLKVDYDGCVDLSGLLKVTAAYGENDNNKVLFKQEFQIEKRQLRIASKVPVIATAGSKLENIVFEIVNSDGIVDETFHHEDKTGSLSHMLAIKADWLHIEKFVRYTFNQGRCIVPSISLSEVAGNYSFSASHSRHSNLSLNVEVFTVKLEHDGISSNSNSLIRVEKSILVLFENNKRGMLKIGLEVGSLEEKCAKLYEEKQKVEQTINELQDSTEPYQMDYVSEVITKEDLVENIENIGGSAAAVLCKISREVPLEDQDNNNHLMKHIIGVVALLGRVGSRQLSRILSEYMGADQMLGVVARSLEAAFYLENYQHTGEVNRYKALHLEAATLGEFIDGRFIVMCFDNISPYKGGFDDHPQRKLALPLPCSIDGTIPKGFLGFAVNMIDLDEDLLSIRNYSGYGLRETVLYHLFGQLQVYETREDMLVAYACVKDGVVKKHGAVSLDGGILKENGVLSFGFSDLRVCFQVAPTNIEKLHHQENLKQLKEKKSELSTICCEMNLVTEKLSKVLEKFEKKKTKFEKFMEDLEHVHTQYDDKNKS